MPASNTCRCAVAMDSIRSESLSAMTRPALSNYSLLTVTQRPDESMVLDGTYGASPPPPPLHSVGSEYALAVPSWNMLEQSEPAFAERVRKLMDAGRHKTIATLRADGSPRISGIECEFTDGTLRFGSMTGARKGADLDRDPRFALHGPTFHPEVGRESEWPGEAKISGRATRVVLDAADGDTDGPDGDLFEADITEVVITALNATATKLVVESWTSGRGLHRVERD